MIQCRPWRRRPDHKCRGYAARRPAPRESRVPAGTRRLGVIGRLCVGPAAARAGIGTGPGDVCACPRDGPRRGADGHGCGECVVLGCEGGEGWNEDDEWDAIYQMAQRAVRSLFRI